MKTKKVRLTVCMTVLGVLSPAVAATARAAQVPEKPKAPAVPGRGQVPGVPGASSTPINQSKAVTAPGRGPVPDVPSGSSTPAINRSQPAARTGRSDDERAIRAVAETFRSAYNAGDAKAVAALYTEDAEIVDEFGERIKGRSNIDATFEALFQRRKGAKIEVSTDAISFLAPDVAKEEGHTRVKPAETEAPETVRRYTLFFVKQGGKWLYSSEREEDEPTLAHQERLKELEWLQGDWVDETSDATVHATCRWSRDKNYLLREFTIHVQGQPVMTVDQRIGWDPLAKQIRSWAFDSEGGYCDGYWTRDGNQWFIKSTGALPDGRPASATQILTRVGAHSAKWASIFRTVGGQVVPNLQEYVLVRRPPKPGSQGQAH
jgi:uncharacterized protein (TIGR02246 family)